MTFVLLRCITNSHLLSVKRRLVLTTRTRNVRCKKKKTPKWPMSDRITARNVHRVTMNQTATITITRYVHLRVVIRDKELVSKHKHNSSIYSDACDKSRYRTARRQSLEYERKLLMGSKNKKRRVDNTEHCRNLQQLLPFQSCERQ